jgi:hypothetical protein
VTVKGFHKIAVVILMTTLAFLVFRMFNKDNALPPKATEASPRNLGAPPMMQQSTGRSSSAIGEPAAAPAHTQEAQRKVPLSSTDYLFGKMFEEPQDGSSPPLFQKIHKVFASEAVDPVWGSQVESELQATMTKPDVSAKVELVSIECHTSICQILGVSPSADGSSQSVDKFQNQIFGMKSQSWWQAYNLTEVTTIVSVGDDGRAVLVGYVTKLPFAKQNQ